MGLPVGSCYLGVYLDEIVKSQEFDSVVIPAPYQVRGKLQPGTKCLCSSRQAQPLALSSHFDRFWTPAFAGVTDFETFHETVNLQRL